MPQRDPGVYLEDIEYYADAAVRFVATYDLEQYLADEKTRAAVERVLERLGVYIAPHPRMGLYLRRSHDDCDAWNR